MIVSFASQAESLEIPRSSAAAKYLIRILIRTRKTKKIRKSSNLSAAAKAARYIKFVEWSEADQVYIGRCPGLFAGGIHGDNEAKVYKELCDVVSEWIANIEMNGHPLPPPTAGKNIVTSSSCALLHRPHFPNFIENRRGKARKIEAQLGHRGAPPCRALDEHEVNRYVSVIGETGILNNSLGYQTATDPE